MIRWLLIIAAMVPMCGCQTPALDEQVQIVDERWHDAVNIFADNAEIFRAGANKQEGARHGLRKKEARAILIAYLSRHTNAEGRLVNTTQPGDGETPKPLLMADVVAAMTKMDELMEQVDAAHAAWVNQFDSVFAKNIEELRKNNDIVFSDKTTILEKKKATAAMVNHGVDALKVLVGVASGAVMGAGL